MDTHCGTRLRIVSNTFGVVWEGRAFCTEYTINAAAYPTCVGK
jgi:hypothetical protein